LQCQAGFVRTRWPQHATYPVGLSPTCGRNLLRVPLVQGRSARRRGSDAVARPGTTVTQRPYGAEIGTLQVAPASAQRIDGMVAHLLPNWITSGVIVAPREEPMEDAMAVFSLRFHDVFAYRRTPRTRQRQGGPWRCRRCVTVGPQDRGPAACKV
jgi:hypothetical protein